MLLSFFTQLSQMFSVFFLVQPYKPFVYPFAGGLLCTARAAGFAL